jgi:tryptophan-rich sensory protein
MRHDLMMLSTGGSMAGVASSALLGKPLGKQWFEQSKKKKWSPANKTRAFKRSQEAASKFY